MAAEIMKSSIYYPDSLIESISKYDQIDATNLAGYHIYCQSDRDNWKWREEKLQICNKDFSIFIDAGVIDDNN